MSLKLPLSTAKFAVNCFSDYGKAGLAAQSGSVQAPSIILSERQGETNRIAKFARHVDRDSVHTSWCQTYIRIGAAMSYYRFTYKGRPVGSVMKFAGNKPAERWVAFASNDRSASFRTRRAALGWLADVANADLATHQEDENAKAQ